MATMTATRGLKRRLLDGNRRVTIEERSTTKRPAARTRDRECGTCYVRRDRHHPWRNASGNSCWHFVEAA